MDRKTIHTRARLVLLLIAVAVVSLGGCGVRATPFTLTLVHHSDGESAILADDYSGSVAQFATVVHRIRDEAGADNALVVSSGDNFLAGLEYAASQGQYDAQALNMAGIEVSAIGNHEFDFGPSGLQRFVDAAEFVFVSSNLDFSSEENVSGYFGGALGVLAEREADKKIFSSVLIEKAGNTIGIVGGTTEAIRVISSPGETIINPVREALQERVDALSEMGVGVIIALTHLQNIEREKALAQQISGVDIFVAGGGDDLIGNSHNNYLSRKNRAGELIADSPTGPYPFETTSASGEPVVVVSTDGSYNYVGKLVVSFDEHGVISEVHVNESGPEPVALNVPADPAVEEAIVQPIAARLESFKGEIVGESISGLDGTREVVRTQESTMGNAIADGYLYSVKEIYGSSVDFAFTNGGGIRRSVVVPANGPVSKLDILTALPFSNYLTVIRALSVDDIVEIFEHAVDALPEAAGHYLQVAGIEVVYNTQNAPSERVQTISVGGEVVYHNGVVVSSETFDAVTNSFLANGGDDYAVLASVPRERTENIGISYAEGFELYLADASPVQSDVEGRLVDNNTDSPDNTDDADSPDNADSTDSTDSPDNTDDADSTDDADNAGIDVVE